MPLINGQKMACAPCIRGHRSTKCNHAAERVMVPVRKPGRPLSTCPCAPGRPCACGGVKVAIPRKQKCHCGPESEPEADGVKAETPSAEPLASPTRPAYRVQKSGSGSKLNGGRKQSIDPTHLDRISPASVNIINQYGDLGPKPLPLNGNGLQAQVQAAAGSRPGFIPSLPANGFGAANNVGYGPALHYNMPMLHHMIPNPVLPPGRDGAENGAQMSSSSQGPNSSANGSYQKSRTSSCGNGTAHDNQASASRGCCCPPKSGSPEMKPAAIAPQHVPQPNGTFLPQFPPQMENMKQQQQYHIPYAQPGIYTYPPNYGSWSHPMNQAMWARMQQLPPNTLPYANVAPVAANENGIALGITHQCNCGPGCQCVGCLAHPFNQQTLQYVGGAWDYDLDVAPAETYSNNVSPNGPSNNNTNGNRAAKPSAGGQGQAQKPEPGSPTQAPTPSDASVCSDDQALSTSDYFFVNLPLFPGTDTDGDACGGNQALCPCGDDCQCDGCVVHNTKPLDQFGA